MKNPPEMSEEASFQANGPSEALGLLARYDLNKSGVLGPEEGQLRSLGGTLEGVLDNTALAGQGLGVGATRIFFDANRNGILDADEVSVVPDGDGFYTFLDSNVVPMDTLGRLRPFDTNENGVIDPAEGTIIITGGYDRNTGLPNVDPIVVPASVLGSGFESTVNPLTGLLGAVSATGLGAVGANTALQAAFGMPLDIQVAGFDPRNVDMSNAASLSAVLAASSKMNHLGYIAAPLFGMDTNAVRALLESEIASRIATMTPRLEGGKYAVQFNLSDKDVVDSVLGSVQTTLGLTLSDAHRGAVATVLAELNLKADQVLAGGAGDPIAGLAPFKAIAQTSLPEQIRRMLAGDITPEQFVATGISPFLAAQEVPIHIVRVDDQTLDGTQVVVPLSFENVNGVSNPYTVQVEVNNPDLVPTSGITMTGNGNNRTLTLTPAFGVSGDATVTIRTLLDRSTGGTLESTESFVLFADPINTVPTISAVAPQFVASGGVVGPIALLVADAERAADLLQITVTSSDPALLASSGITLSGSGATRYLTLTPEALGPETESASVDVTVDVSDGVLSSTTQFVLSIVSEEQAAIVARNDAPSFTMGSDQVHPENSGSRTVANWATDISPGPSDESAQSVQFIVSNDNNSLFTAQPTISVDGQLGYVIRSNTSGTATVTVQLKDDGGTANGSEDTSEALTFTISTFDVNYEPVLGVINGKFVAVGSELSFVVAASDIDGDTLIYRLAAGAPAGASIDPVSGLFRWTPSDAHGGARHLITVRVTDSGSPNLSVARTFAVDVSAVPPVVPANNPPSIASVPDQSVRLGQTLKLTVFASDPDEVANRLVFSLDQAPAGASLDSQTGVFSWNPTGANDLGDAVVSIRVSDNGQPSLSAVTRFKINVLSNPNTAPVMASVANQRVLQGMLLEVANAAGDADVPAQKIAWSLNAGAPQGMGIDAATGLVKWQVDLAQAPGVYSVTVKATDNGTPQLSVQKTFDVEVVALNVAPTIKPVENLKLTLGAPVPAVRLSGISAGAVNEKQEILISAVSDNPGLIPNPEVRYSTPGGDGVLVLIPAANQLGEATISVTVKDSGGVVGGGKDTTVVQFKVTILPGGQQKVYFQNDDGTLALWEMNGTKLVRAAYVDPANPGEAGWTVQAVADFDLDGKRDLVLQHQDGRVAAWFMDGAKLKAGTMLTPTTTGDRNWRVVGAADMDGDGGVDLVFQHSGNGMLAAWLVDGVTLRQALLLNPSAPGQQGWGVVGTGDFNNDGKADLVFQHNDGTIAFWLMNSTNLVSGRVLEASQSLGSSWRVRGVADLNQDNHLDLMVQTGDGSLSALFLNGTLLLEQVLFDPLRTDAAWHLVGS